MNILEFIPFGRENAVTTRKLTEITGIKSSRKIRNLISQERRNTAILNLQDGKGYFRPTDEEIKLVERFKKQEQSRAKKIFWSLRGCNEFIKEKGYGKATKDGA